MWFLCLACFAWLLASSSASSPACGGTLTARAGTISTPDFPAAFRTPIHCQWLISKSDSDANGSIVVYLTQVFVTTGLKFTEYLYYDSAYKAGARVVHAVSESSATHVKWLQVAGPYLLVELALSRLEGHHLRALPALLDVFGFNITYEISTAEQPVKQYQCNTIECRFLGHCYANHDYSKYGCSCFPGYSGRDCGEGPLCARHGRPTCHNGGTCRQMGAAAVSCDCPSGFTGDLCELPVMSPAGCEDGSCVLECSYDGNPNNACNCRPDNSVIVTPERTRFEAVLKLAEKPKQPVSPDSQRQMTSFLKSLNVTKDIEVTNISADGSVWLQAWGSEAEGPFLQAALARLPRLATLRLAPSALKFHSEPALFLQTVAVNQRPVVWEGAEFIMSCEAQGAPHMTFSWFKDGVPVNVSRATRNTWMRLVGNEGGVGARWTALLGVARAARADTGVFSCQAAVRGRQQCRELRLHVLAPEVRLAPMSVTAHKGENVSLTCLSANSGGLHGKLGYSWTRNRALFPLTPASEVWEDLAPAGSILHLYNIQKSAEYSCHVSSAVSTRVRSVYVRAVEDLVPKVQDLLESSPSSETVLSRGGGLCPAGGAWGLRWPQAAPADHLIECPQGFTGHVTRICEMRNAPFESEWNIPDFSNCVADGMNDIYTEFQRITFGYGNTSAVGVLRRYLSYVRSRAWLYPGEGGAILRKAKATMDYLSFLNSSAEKDEAVEPFFSILNQLLKSENAVLDQQGVQELQQAVVMGAALGGGPSLRLSELSVHCDSIRPGTATYHTEFPFSNTSHDRWDKESIDLYLAPIDGAKLVPNKSILMFINYRNLTKYFTSLYYSTEVKDGNGLEYWVASHIVAVRVANGDGTVLALPSGAVSFQIKLFHSPPMPRPKSSGTIVCGRYENGMWSEGACKTLSTSGEVTQCSCDDQGMYALLLARQTTQNGALESGGSQQAVWALLGGASLTLLASGLLLFPAWLRRRCCLLYLKLHYCFTTSLALALMLYCLMSDWCGNMSGGWLELLLLGGGAALVAQLLLLHAELAWPAPPPPNLPRTILMLMMGVCVLAALCSRAAGGSGWGLRAPSTPLAVFGAASALLAALHFLLCVCVASRLRLLRTKLPDRHHYIEKRVGMMRRSAAIFLCSKAFEIASIVHYNLPGPISSNILAATAALLGIVVFGCYILRDEMSGGLRRLLRPKETDWDCSSDYANTSLSFFIKQGCDAESRSAPGGGECSMPLAQQPASLWRTPPSMGHLGMEHRDRSMGKQADIVKSVEFKNIPPMMDSPGRQTAGGSLGGPVSSVCDLVPSCASSLPSAEPPTHQPQEYVTRVCVELGILNRNPPPPPNEPPILLCAVDFEQYPECKYNLGPLDTADNCVLCVNSKQEAMEPPPSLPIKSCLKNKEAHPIYRSDIVLKESPSTESEDESQAVSDQEMTVEEHSTKECNVQPGAANDPNMDGMLDLISHDLDYLLNRNSLTASGAGTSGGKTQPSAEAKPFVVLDKIQEESL